MDCRIINNPSFCRRIRATVLRMVEKVAQGFGCTPLRGQTPREASTLNWTVAETRPIASADIGTAIAPVVAKGE